MPLLRIARQSISKLRPFKRRSLRLRAKSAGPIEVTPFFTSAHGPSNFSDGTIGPESASTSHVDNIDASDVSQSEQHLEDVSDAYGSIVVCDDGQSCTINRSYANISVRISPIESVEIASVDQEDEPTFAEEEEELVAAIEKEDIAFDCSDPAFATDDAKFEDVVCSKETSETEESNETELGADRDGGEGEREFSIFLGFLDAPHCVTLPPVGSIDRTNDKPNEPDKPISIAEDYVKEGCEKEQVESCSNIDGDPATLEELSEKTGTNVAEDAGGVDLLPYTRVTTRSHTSGFNVGDRVRVARIGHKKYGSSGIMYKRTACYAYFKDEKTQERIKIMPRSLALVSEGMPAEKEKCSRASLSPPNVSPARPKDVPIGSSVTVLPTHRKHGGKVGKVQRHTPKFVVVEFGDNQEAVRITPKFLVGTSHPHCQELIVH